LDGYDAEDPHRPILFGTSTSTDSMSTPPATDTKLIGFSCPVCGYLRSAEEHLLGPVPVCAGSKVRTGRTHEPAQMEALLLN
jgi:hypothetical protein